MQGVGKEMSAANQREMNKNLSKRFGVGCAVVDDLTVQPIALCTNRVSSLCSGLRI